MPAAAVIPAPQAYINVVAVKKLVVGYLSWWAWPNRAFVQLCAGFGADRSYVASVMRAVGYLLAGHPSGELFCHLLGWGKDPDRLL